MIRNGGRVVTARLGEQLSAVHLKPWCQKSRDNRITCHTRRISRAIQMMSRGLLHPDLLITDIQPLKNIKDAFLQVDQETPGHGQGCFRYSGCVKQNTGSWIALK